MRFIELIYNGDKIVNQNRIIDILETTNLHWLIDSEVEDAKIEIKNNTLIWHSGNYFSGNWYYGIFKSGKFFGNFKNGIFEGGEFKGKYISGLNLTKV